MINHGELTKLLLDFEHTTPKMLPAFIGKVIQATSGGVIREGGPLVSSVLPTTPAGDILVGFTATQASDNSADYVPHVTQHDSGFKFGKSSERELVGVNDDLVRVTRLALKYSTQDFTVFDGIRTLKEQQTHVRNGTSKTMQSKHLDGLAVDLVPWIGGKPVWDWDGCYKIACAMDLAATELGLAHRITWGGAWDRKLSDFGGDVTAYAREVQAYQKRHAGPDFIDGPHFEILPS